MEAVSSIFRQIILSHSSFKRLLFLLPDPEPSDSDAAKYYSLVSDTDTLLIEIHPLFSCHSIEFQDSHDLEDKVTIVIETESGKGLKKYIYHLDTLLERLQLKEASKNSIGNHDPVGYQKNFIVWTRCWSHPDRTNGCHVFGSA